MNTILLKVQQYLDSVSKKPSKLDEKLVEEFGEACKNALLKQFEEPRRDKFEVRMSNIGRPLCQLQMEAKGIKGEGQPYNVKMRNTFGDANTVNNKYIYLAFAEEPLVANVGASIPATAR